MFRILELCTKNTSLYKSKLAYGHVEKFSVRIDFLRGDEAPWPRNESIDDGNEKMCNETFSWIHTNTSWKYEPTNSDGSSANLEQTFKQTNRRIDKRILLHVLEIMYFDLID